MQLRHELKHQISQTDLIILRQRLGAVMSRDRHTIDGKYEIRSLYFDNPDDQALRDKLDGVRDRVKYRIRIIIPPTSSSTARNTRTSESAPRATRRSRPCHSSAVSATASKLSLTIMTAARAIMDLTS